MLNVLVVTFHTSADAHDVMETRSGLTMGITTLQLPVEPQPPLLGFKTLHFILRAHCLLYCDVLVSLLEPHLFEAIPVPSTLVHT